MIDASGQVTQREFGDLVGISQPAVSDLMSRGIIAEGASLGDWLKWYCGHLREMAAGRAAMGDLDLAMERAALARAQRKKIEMQNAVTLGELAPVTIIEEVLTKAAVKVAGILDAIPGIVRRRVPQLNADDIQWIAIEVAKARNIAAVMSLEDLREEAEDAGQEDGVMVQALIEEGGQDGTV